MLPLWIFPYSPVTKRHWFKAMVDLPAAVCVLLLNCILMKRKNIDELGVISLFSIYIHLHARLMQCTLINRNEVDNIFKHLSKQWVPQRSLQNYHKNESNSLEDCFNKGYIHVTMFSFFLTYHSCHVYVWRQQYSGVSKHLKQRMLLILV